jgi:hypothetical protein
MPSSGILHHVALVRTDASIIRVTRIGEIGTWLLVTANVAPSSPIFVMLMMEALRSSESSVLNYTWRNIPEDDILHSHSCETPKSYETDPVSKTLCFLIFRIPDDRQSPEIQ